MSVAKIFAGILAGGAFLTLMMTEIGPSEPPREFVSVVVMMNAEFAKGQGPPRAPSLVLVDLDQEGQVSTNKIDIMKRVASRVYRLYADDFAGHSDPAMVNFVRHLKNDRYRPSARIAVPPSLTNGRQRMYVADIMLLRENLSQSRRKVAIVGVTGEERGTIRHIPFDNSMIRHSR